MYSSPDGTNFVINTCEWPNGPHILFATAKGQDNIATSGAYGVNTAYGASAYVPVTFDNFISRVAFSQQFFEPSLGQTQEVTAAFAANAAWTLQIMNEDSNVVRTVTGSGPTLKFDWDGTGNGGTNLSNGIYYYNISAQSNGPLPSVSFSNPDGSDSLPPGFASASLANSDATELFAMPADGSGAAVPLVLYPPGFDTNKLTIFEASWSEIMRPSASRLRASSMDSSGTMFSASTGGTADGMGGASSDAAGSTGSGSESTTAPTRPPTVPIRGPNGMYGVAYYDFATQKSHQVPFNGLPGYPRPQLQEIQGSTGSFTFTNISLASGCADRFAARMQRGGWKEGFKKSGASVSLNDLRSTGLGGNDIFAGVTIGLFESHGFYGTKPDYNQPYANGAFETYVVSDNPTDANAPWFRLSEFGFGGSLRYMAILACNMLTDANNNYSSMKDAGVLPIPSNLHLLCGCSSLAILTEDIGELWADNMCSSGGLFGSRQTVKAAWFNAGSDSYRHLGTEFFLFPVTFRVAGWSSAMNDTIKNVSDSTSGNITKLDQQVH